MHDPSKEGKRFCKNCRREITEADAAGLLQRINEQRLLAAVLTKAKKCPPEPIPLGCPHCGFIGMVHEAPQFNRHDLRRIERQNRGHRK